MNKKYIGRKWISFSMKNAIDKSKKKEPGFSMSNSNKNTIIKCIGNICKIQPCKHSIKLTNN